MIYSWEYPDKQGIGCNVVSPNDTANFLLFLQTLRSQKGGQNISVSAAVPIAPFVGPDGTPMTDVSKFAEALDYIGSPFSHLSIFPPLSDDATQKS
jgi:chitinase